MLVNRSVHTLELDEVPHCDAALSSIYASCKRNKALLPPAPPITSPLAPAHQESELPSETPGPAPPAPLQAASHVQSAVATLRSIVSFGSYWTGVAWRRSTAAALGAPPSTRAQQQNDEADSSMSHADLSALLLRLASLPTAAELQSQQAVLQAQLSTQGAALSPLHEARLLQLAGLRARECILSNSTASSYAQHLRLLILCAHTGAAALRSGNVAGEGSGAAAAGTLAIQEVPGLILKALGKAAESIPLLGAGASALTALIAAADGRALHVKMQAVVRLAHSPAELSALIDALTRRLTLLQWATLSSPAALQQATAAATFRQQAVQALGRAQAQALYALKGERALDAPQKQALADAEAILAAVADGTLRLDCTPAVAADPVARAEELALRCARLLLPGRASYEEELPVPPFEAACSSVASSSLAPSTAAAVLSPSAGSAASPSAVLLASGASSPRSPVDAELATLRVEMAATKAAHAAELARLHKAAALQAARMAKLEEAASPQEAGDGLAYARASASPRSAQQQREANSKSHALLQAQVDALTRQLAAMAARELERDAPASAEEEAEAEEGARLEQQARWELRNLKAELGRK
jgi:hypothetical protein